MQGMGMIDEGYESNRCQNGQSSTQITNLKSQSMISSPVEGQSIQASSENGEGSFSRLRYESKRLSTFDKWPASAKVEPRKIAKAGFFYTGQYAEAKCLWCGCVITTWEYGDQVMTRHRSASPDCPFVRDISDNIPLLNSTASSTNIVNSHSEDPYIHLESRNDSVDHGHHHGQNTNSGMASPDPAAETTDEIQIAPMMVDEIEINVNEMETSSPVGGHLGASNLNNGFQSQPYITSSSSRTGSELQSGSGSGELRHPVSGRRLSGDPMNRPTVVSPDLDDNIYKIEAERLRTFEAWPLSFIRPADLANAGFVYTGRGDCVRCVFCGEHVGEWDEDDFPHTEHRSLFPHCPFVRGIDVGNVPSNTEIRDTYDRQIALHPWPHNNQRMQSGASSEGDDRITNVTLNSSQEPPTTQYTGSASRNRLRPNSGQNNTFYRRQHSHQSTRSANISNQRPRSTSFDHHPLLDRNFLESLRSNALGGDVRGQGNDEAGIRSRPSGGPEKGLLQFTNNGGANKDGGLDGIRSSSGARGAQPEDIGIIQHSGPANSKYSTVEARARTFREWPPALKQTPIQLSEAGFFYIGLSDQVKCFYCDGGLRNWQAEDDPWTEHARWFSECGFVRLVKGDEFISKCINKHPPESVQGLHVISRDRSRTTVHEDELQQMMSSPLVHQVLAMGIQSAQVKKALRQRLQETGSGFKFVNELVEAALLQPEEKNAITNREGIQSTSSTNERVTFGTSNCPTAQNSSRFPSSQSQVPRLESHRPSSNSTSHTISAAAPPRPLTSATTCKPQSGFTHNQNSEDLGTRTCASAPGTLESNIEMGFQKGPSTAQRIGNVTAAEGSIDLEVENRRLKDQRTCKICMDREIGVVFLPCGHLISCVQCAPALKDCPLCRQPIHGTVKTYMS